MSPSKMCASWKDQKHAKRDESRALEQRANRTDAALKGDGNRAARRQTKKGQKMTELFRLAGLSGALLLLMLTPSANADGPRYGYIPTDHALQPPW